MLSLSLQWVLSLSYNLIVFFLGDVEMALELDTCISTVICNSNATVMILDTKNYDRLVAKKNQQTLIKISERALQKLQCRCHTTKGSMTLSRN